VSYVAIEPACHAHTEIGTAGFVVYCARMAAVDFVVNCWEADYRQLLAPGAIAAKAAQHRYPDLHTTVLVNNVHDRSQVESMAAASGADRVAFVEDYIEKAFATIKVRRSILRRGAYFSDWPLAALVLPGPDKLLAWAGDIRLRESHDWVTPSLTLLEADPRVLVANPAWYVEGQVDTLAEQQIAEVGDFGLGYGFSDQAFLVSRSDFARIDLDKVAPASWRFTLTGAVAVFEQRVDAALRRSRRLRATYTRATYVHPAAGAGSTHPPMTRGDRLRRRAAFAVRRQLDRPPFQHPALRVRPDRL